MYMVDFHLLKEKCETKVNAFIQCIKQKIKILEPVLKRNGFFNYYQKI